ncbi:MAG: glycosyltransferase [Planctomycetota bacterium]|nr:glycosyltransferase [Planctomycetota bacterium]
MRTSVVVCTYNAPRELDLVLCGLSRQTRPPDEVLIADDGSTDDTAQLVASWQDNVSFPLVHVWHEDRGFRKARVSNEAVRRSKGDHLVFLDGDSIPHRKWMEDHVGAADDDRILCGRRVKLGPRLTSGLARSDVEQGRLEAFFGPVLKSTLAGDTARFVLGIRLPVFLARLFHPRARKLMGVNFSLPRRRFEAVNGYDEDLARRLDWDLELRLRRSDFLFYPLLNRAVVYHLHHEPAGPTNLDGRLEASVRTRCEHGLDSGGFDEES